MNAWPAWKTVYQGGWVLRFTGGYTRRANSVHPLYPPESQIPLDERIGACAALYREQDQAVIFKLTTASQPEGLDSALESLGYRVDLPTSVQTVNLGLHPPVEPRLHPAEWDEPAPAWMDAFCALSQVNERNRPYLERILTAIVPQRRFMALYHAGQAVACGLAVLEAGWVGLFDIITHPEYRRQGFGEAVVQSLVSWAKREGARHSYLQVVATNEPALRLYDKLGYETAYTYWYRVKS